MLSRPRLLREEPDREETTMPERKVHVPKISCGHCVRTIEQELGELPGVASVHADAATRQVEISWEAPADWAAIEALLAEIGFPPAEA